LILMGVTHPHKTQTKLSAKTISKKMKVTFVHSSMMTEPEVVEFLYDASKGVKEWVTDDPKFKHIKFKDLDGIPLTAIYYS
jgi:hypothetical protein